MTQTQPPVDPSPTDPARPCQPTLGELVARISDNVTGLVKGEIDLAKAKGKRMLAKLKLGAALLAAAGVLALWALGLLFDAAALGIGQVLPLWAGYLIVAIVVLIIVTGLYLVGRKKIDAALADTPAPQEGLKQGVTTATTALKAGIEKGNQK